jgi:LysM repeat protein
MKILQIFGAVVAVHLLAFIFIFASPGCQSGPGPVPTPDATVPTAVEAPAPVSFAPVMPSAQPVDLSAPAPSYAGSSGHAAPTRPGSAAAVAVMPEAKPAVEVAPVTTYVVGRGDSLWSIAKKNHLTVAELAKANNLGTGSTLQPGRKLFIPGKPGAMAAPVAAKEAASTPAATAESAAPTAGKAGIDSVKHTVQVGESLGIIARKYQVSVGELATANNITDPSKVRAGQQLIIPGFKTVTTKNTAAAKSGAAPKSAVKPAPADKTVAATPPPPAAPKFEIMAPPPGQDLDSGLKDTNTEVPTVKVEDNSEPKK